MENNFLTIDPEKEKNKIVSFLKRVFEKQKISKAVIGLSGGIDSGTSFYLLKEVLPPEDIFVTHLYYFEPYRDLVDALIADARIPPENVKFISIKKPIDAVKKLLSITEESDKVRIGNIAARMRMIVLFDLAKKQTALVCGTENKSENLLGYFTRFGDQASDIEPIAHLYKTQVYQLARYLGVPEDLLKQKPTAGLWQGQTDEGEFGFSYEEADQVLSLHLEKSMDAEAIFKRGFPNAHNILARRSQNLFKSLTPYHL